MDQFGAAYRGDLPQLHATLTAGNVNEFDSEGWTALHFSAFEGSVDCTNYCLEMGANVNTRDFRGHTPLLYASSLGRVNVVRMLLDVGAIADTTSYARLTPLYRAIRFKRFDVARLLIDRGAKLSSVLLDKWIPEIPNWITTFIDSRSNCRCAAIVIIGIHKYHRTTVTGNNDVNVLRLISKHIWSTRMDDVWVETNKLRRNGSKNK
jgi:ankyrin repeat protein